MNSETQDLDANLEIKAKQSLVSGLFPPTVCCKMGVISQMGVGTPWPEAVSNLRSIKRKREFTAGRRLAAEALAELGITNADVHQDTDRVPIWPVTVAGSISHSRDLCAAVVGMKYEHLSLGVDMEQVQELRMDFAPRICTPEESAWLDQQSSGKQLKMLALLFSAKECFYKTQFPLTRQWLRFHDVKCTVLQDSAFRVESRVPMPAIPQGAHLGRYGFHQGWVLTGMRFPA